MCKTSHARIEKEAKPSTSIQDIIITSITK